MAVFGRMLHEVGAAKNGLKGVGSIAVVVVGQQRHQQDLPKRRGRIRKT